MSTELTPTGKGYTLTRFWGGPARGVSMQVTFTVTDTNYAYFSVDSLTGTADQFMAESMTGISYDPDDEEIMFFGRTIHFSEKRWKALKYDVRRFMVDPMSMK